MPAYKVFKEVELPSTLTAHAIYLVAPSNAPDYLEIYVTDAAGTVARRVPTIHELEALVKSEVDGTQAMFVANDITERDALAPTKVSRAYVIDATADETVDSGGASYIYDPAQGVWIKTSEDESMDLVINWADIVGGPSSTPAQIDTAVTNSHTHANKTEMDKIGEDEDGNLTYNGDLPVMAWASTGW